jgi:hypothetical protein
VLRIILLLVVGPWWIISLLWTGGLERTTSLSHFPRPGQGLLALGFRTEVPPPLASPGEPRCRRRSRLPANRGAAASRLPANRGATAAPTSFAFPPQMPLSAARSQLPTSSRHGVTPSLPPPPWSSALRRQRTFHDWRHQGTLLWIYPSWRWSPRMESRVC